MTRDGQSPDASPGPTAEAPTAAQPDVVRSRPCASVSGAYSLADTRESVIPSSREERLSWTQPISERSRAGLVELRRMPLAAMTVTANRRLIAANPSACRLLELQLGFELDDQHLRCTEPDYAPRFAKLVSDAATATQRRQEFHGAFELRRPGSEGWLDVVVAGHPEQGSPYALIVMRSRQ